MNPTSFQMPGTSPEVAGPSLFGSFFLLGVVILLLNFLIGGGIGCLIGNLGGKQNGWLGLLLGAVLGPIGWIIVAVLPPSAAGKSRGKDNDRIASLEAEIAALKAGGTRMPPLPVAHAPAGSAYKLD